MAAYGKIIKSQFIPKDTIFVVNKNVNFDKWESSLEFKPIQGKDVRGRLPISIGSMAKRVRTERTFKEKLKCLPYIMKIAFKHGWKQRRLKDYLTYKPVVSTYGLSISGISA